jgi:pyruvate, water dikinase
MAKSNYIKWFNEVGKNDVELVGGKGANLGEMIQAGFPVPNGFVVTSNTYSNFIEETGIKSKILKTLKNLDVNDSQKLSRAAETCRQLIINASPSPEIKNAIISAYQKLSAGKPSLVAIRSSSIFEDSPEASFAGQQESFMNIQGKNEVLQTIKLAWASLFEDRAIFYRAQKKRGHTQIDIAVPVQLMVNSEISGVMFTADPISNDTTTISIEAGYGYGDAVVGGEITPDQYTVSKENLKILDRQLSKQDKMLVRANKAPKKTEPFHENSELYWIPISKAYQEKQKLSDKHIQRLAEIGAKIEKHYGHPQDIEWAFQKGKLYIVQTRPITTMPDYMTSGVEENVQMHSADNPSDQFPDALLSGLGASPGIGIGPVVHIKNATEIGKVKKGDVLVTDMTTPDFVPAMRKAVAIVTNLGGRTSHAAIVSRELGIPAVVGTELATQILKTGEIITVDGKRGKVYQGNHAVDSPAVTNKARTGLNLSRKTATKLYTVLGEPKIAEEVSQLDVDGVGLLRAEFMMANIGRHPRYMLEAGKKAAYIDDLYEGIVTFAKSFDPRPVIYRTTDFRANEYRGLKGGEKFEIEEENPLLGFRGVGRYVADTEVFRMELEAIKKVRRYHQNLWVMLPFVRTPEELIEAKKIMTDEGLYRTGTFKLFIVVEVPATVLMLERFIGVGIDGVSIGTSDLTQLILGVDRDNQRTSNLYDEQNPAVLWAIEHTIKTCAKHGVISGICGQSTANHPELCKKIVEWGANSISVLPDQLEQTRAIISQAEFEHIIKRKL